MAETGRLTGKQCQTPGRERRKHGGEERGGGMEGTREEGDGFSSEERGAGC